MSLSSRAAQSVRWTSALTVWELVIGLAQIAVLAKFFQPGEFGAIAIMTILLAIANVFVRVGFSDGIIASKDLDQRQLSTLYWFNLVGAILVYAAIWACADLLAKLVTVPSFSGQVRVISLTLVIGALAVQFEALCRKELKFKLLSILGIVRTGMVFILLLVLLNDGWSLWGFVVGMLAGQAAYSGFLLLYSARRGWLPRFHFAPGEVVELLRFGGYRIGAALLNNVTNRIDQVAIAGFLGPVELGYYNMAHGIAMKPFQKIGPILSRVSFPVFASISNDVSKMLHGYRKGVRMILFVNAPLLIGYIAVAPKLIPLYLGPNWEPTIIISQVLAVYALFRTAANINIGLILARGKYRWPLYWNAFMSVLLPLIVFSASRGGATILDIAIILVFVQAGVFLLSYFLFPRRLLTPFGLKYLSDLSRPIFVALMMYLVVFTLDHYLPGDESFLRLIVLVGSGGAVYFMLSFLFQSGNVKEALEIAFGPRNSKN